MRETKIEQPKTEGDGLPGTALLRLKGFSEAGEYKGRLAISASGYKPVETDFTVQVRDPAWAAALLFALGCGLSWWIRRWADEQRPKALLLARVLQVRAGLLDWAQARRAAGLNDQPGWAQPVLASWQGSLDQIERQLSSPAALSADEATSLDQRLSALDGKRAAFEDWARCWDEVVARVTDSATRKTLEARLHDFATTLSGDQALSDAQASSLRDAVSAVRNQAFNPAPDAGAAAAGASRATAADSAVPPQVQRSRLLAALQRRDRWVVWVSIAAAVATGLVFVWNANPVWGGLADWALALLWGLGLQQVGSYSFNGLAGVTRGLLGRSS